MALLHAFVDLGFGAGFLLDGVCRLWVELISAGDDGLVDPVFADALAEYVEGGLVVFVDQVGVVGFSPLVIGV